MELHEIDKFIEYLNKKLNELKEINAPDTFINCIQAVKIDLKILFIFLRNRKCCQKFFIR